MSEDLTTSAPTAGMSEAVTNPSVTGTPAAPAETVATPSADASSPPQAEKPAGTEDQPQQEDKPEDIAKAEAEKARKAERSKERWQAKNRELAESRRRESFLLGELERLQKQQPDLSQISDPNERFIKQTAAEVRSGQIEDTKARAQQEQQIRQTAMLEAWSVVQEEMRAKAPDFDQVFNQTPLHARAAPFIVESEKGGEIAYWLGKNPDAARDLYQKFETAPAQALIELGRIEARVSAPPPKQVSTAPKPAPVLNGGVSPLGFDIHKSSVSDTAAMLRKAGIIR